MFYLLKSDHTQTEQILIDANKIEAIGLYYKKFNDHPEKTYAIKVFMNSGDWLSALYSSLENAKEAIKEMLGDKLYRQHFDDLTAYEGDD